MNINDVFSPGIIVAGICVAAALLIAALAMFVFYRDDQRYHGQRASGSHTWPLSFRRGLARLWRRGVPLPLSMVPAPMNLSGPAASDAAVRTGLAGEPVKAGNLPGRADRSYSRKAPGLAMRPAGELYPLVSNTKVHQLAAQARATQDGWRRDTRALETLIVAATPSMTGICRMMPPLDQATHLQRPDWEYTTGQFAAIGAGWTT